MSSNTRCSGLSRQRGQVAGRNYPPTNKNTLIRALTEEWDKLPQQLLDNVVQSMVRRVECCITLHGGHIPLGRLNDKDAVAISFIRIFELPHHDAHDSLWSRYRTHGRPAQVSSSSLDRGLRLRDPSPIALVQH
ncbi:hypothetical protein TNCV_3038081 [Trichonephila clavipes]|nr:hypothetical protein TNCV_3038081 [Trichonephila clavipes]